MGDRARWGLWAGAVAGCVLALLLLYELRGLLLLILVAFVLAAGKVLGVWGILFAVPAAAVLRVLIPELWEMVQQRHVQVER